MKEVNIVAEKLVIGTRGSKLAIWQANYVAAKIKEQYPGFAVIINNIKTTGDKVLDMPLAQIGGKGLFTAELEKAILTGDIDIAVHSMKDVPTELPAGLVLGAVTERLDAGDALISPCYHTLDRLPSGGKVGTSSLRRKAQLLNYRPDLTMVDLRGNVDTRLLKLETEGLDAIVLAVAGLKRLGLEERITQVLPQDICLPAMGQGTLAIEIRRDDVAVREMIAFLNDCQTLQAVRAERAFLKVIEGGCQVPVGVYGRVQGEGLVLDAVILSVDGKRRARDRITGRAEAAESLGLELAARMLDNGGRDILSRT